MTSHERYDVENDEMKAILRDIGAKIGTPLPTGWGYMLLIFEFGENGSLFYISSAEREGVIKTVEEWLRRERLELARQKEAGQ